MSALYEQFFLFGDSITQDGFSQQRGFGFAAALQHAYIRRLDVVNRGLSGYNTRQALKVLPSVIPSPDQHRIRFFVVFFGANDASLAQAENKQHVPREEFKANLEAIVTHPRVAAHNARIILVAPPPINEHLQWQNDKERGCSALSRVAPNTKSYADTVVELGAALHIPVLNLWEAFMGFTNFQVASWKEGDPIPGSMDVPQSDDLVRLMYDGLHFSPDGYELYFRKMMELIHDKWPDQNPEALPMVLPPWNDPAAWEAWDAASS